MRTIATITELGFDDLITVTRAGHKCTGLTHSVVPGVFAKFICRDIGCGYLRTVHEEDIRSRTTTVTVVG